MASRRILTALSVGLFIVYFYYSFQAEVEVLVESSNVDVTDKMIVSGYDVKVSKNPKSR